MSAVHLLLGSNLGDRERYLAVARKLIEQKIGPIDKLSSLYETASWGNTGLPPFINQVIRVTTHLTAAEVLKKAIEIETEAGRIRSEKWGSRILDIDILFFGDLVINSDDLKVPHPQLHLRKFTLLPFSEIEPGFIHPVLKKTISEILEELTDLLPVFKLN